MACKYGASAHFSSTISNSCKNHSSRYIFTKLCLFILPMTLLFISTIFVTHCLLFIHERQPFIPLPLYRKGVKMMIFLPFSKFKGSALAHLSTTMSRELYFNPSRYNKQVWFENYAAIGT